MQYLAFFYDWPFQLLNVGSLTVCVQIPNPNWIWILIGFRNICFQIINFFGDGDIGSSVWALGTNATSRIVREFWFILVDLAKWFKLDRTFRNFLDRCPSASPFHYSISWVWVFLVQNRCTSFSLRKKLRAFIKTWMTSIFWKFLRVLLVCDNFTICLVLTCCGSYRYTCTIFFVLRLCNILTCHYYKISSCDIAIFHSYKSLKCQSPQYL